MSNFNFNTEVYKKDFEQVEKMAKERDAPLPFFKKDESTKKPITEDEMKKKLEELQETIQPNSTEWKNDFVEGGLLGAHIIYQIKNPVVHKKLTPEEQAKQDEEISKGLDELKELAERLDKLYVPDKNDKDYYNGCCRLR